MPRMTNAKSAPVLNSADEFERKLSWQLFVAEQEALLAYDPNKDEDGYPVWNVGDPVNHYMDFETAYLGDGDYAITYSSAACHRPMIELIRYDGVDTALKPDCDDCDVLWDGNEPCFVCGGPRNEPWPDDTLLYSPPQGMIGPQGSPPWDGLITVAPYSQSEALHNMVQFMAESFQQVTRSSERAARAMQPVVRRALENERGEERVVPTRAPRIEYIEYTDTDVSFTQELYRHYNEGYDLQWRRRDPLNEPNQVRGRSANYMWLDEAGGLSMYLTTDQAERMAPQLDIPPELLTRSPSQRSIPLAEQIDAINRMSVDPYSAVLDVETEGIGPLPRPILPLASVPTAQNPQNGRRRPRMVPDTNRSYPTSEPNWRRRRPKRA